MTLKRKHRSLSRKLAAAVFRVALLFAVLASEIFFVAEYKRSSAKTLVMANQLLDTVESTAAIAAYSDNRQIGEDVLKGLLRNDIVHSVRLTNYRGFELREAKTGVTGYQTEVVRILYSPFGDEESIGQLSILPEARFDLWEARDSAVVSALYLSGLIGLTALIVLLVVRGSLSRPLLRVSERLHAISAGERERLDVLPFHEDDELGQLVEDINRLLDTLQDKFAAERALRENVQAVERQLRSIFETTSAGIFLLDGTGRVLAANPTLGRVLGLPDLASEDLVGREFPALAFAEPERMQELMRRAKDRATTVAEDLPLKARDGEPGGGWVHCLLSRQADAAGKVRFEGVVYDITERRAAELRIKHEADHDLLTGLFRRPAAERELLRLLGAAPEQESAHVVVLLLDLDDFKAVNDTYGHAAGDAVLVTTARRLRACVRADDLVARLGGDEFLIVLVGSIPLERACGVAREIVSAVTQPIELHPGLAVRVGASVGMAVHAETEQNLDHLLKTADFAMYEVKREGKNGYALAWPDGSVKVERVAA
jgi:diguanylate cyclase (GGDEF)-like protein/PAS domain S-box-containing protein